MEGLLFQEMKQRSIDFDNKLRDTKEQNPMRWYPYGSMSNMYHLEHLFQGGYEDFFSRLHGKQIADIGTADGDMAFFLESIGFEVDMIDCKQPNYNKLEGANQLKTLLSSKNNIYDIDLDSQFQLPKKNYDLIIFMGILYHLKNPYYILEQLAYSSKYMVLSTRVARTTKDERLEFKDVPIAYLMDASETDNGDSTNYWIFSEAGLKRVLHRTRWDIVRFITVGNQINSDPGSSDRDERAFCLLRSRVFN